MALTFIDPGTTAIVATFLFVFAVVYALLSYSKIFMRKDKDGNPVGEEPRKIYALLAVVFGFFAAAYEPLVVGLQAYIPYAAVLLIIIFVVVFLKRLFGGKKDKASKFDAFGTVFTLGTLLFLFGIFWEQFSTYLPGSLNSTNTLWIVGIVIIIAILYAVHKHPEKLT